METSKYRKTKEQKSQRNRQNDQSTEDLKNAIAKASKVKGDQKTDAPKKRN